MFCISLKCKLFALILVVNQLSSALALIGHPDLEVNNYFKRTDGITSGDGGFSVALNDGRTVWLFGDSHVNDVDKKDGLQPCFFQARNSAMVQPNNDWSHNGTKTLVGAPTPFKSLFKCTDDKKNFFWTGHGIQIGETAYVYCVELTNTGEGKFGFKSTGNDQWCKLDVKTLKFTGLEKLPDFNGIDFGQGFVTNDDHYIYGYGTKGNGKMMGTAVYVSRFNRSDPVHSYEYWDGHHYVKDVKEAKPVAEEYGGSVAVFKVKNKYVLLNTEFSVQCDQGHRIYARISDSVTGPFAAKHEIHSIDEAKENNHYPFFYMPAAHPQLINKKNELLITYSINGYEPCQKGCPNNKLSPDHYRLRGVRVNIDELFKLH